MRLIVKNVVRGQRICQVHLMAEQFEISIWGLSVMSECDLTQKC